MGKTLTKIAARNILENRFPFNICDNIQIHLCKSSFKQACKNEFPQSHFSMSPT